jgi:hypothetical protein
MRLYHFLSQKHALEALRNKRIKVSIINKLNDPFEFLPRFLNSNRETLEGLFREWKDKTAKTQGIICFSKRWINPLLWSHYADKHNGIALGFDISENLLYKVKYRKERLLCRWDGIPQDKKLGESFMKKLIKTKFSSWEYEEEFRFGCTLSNCIREGEIYFEKFDSNLILKEVITGCNNTLSDEKLLSLLGEFEKIAVIRSKKHLRHYQIVKEKEVVIL